MVFFFFSFLWILWKNTDDSSFRLETPPLLKRKRVVSLNTKIHTKREYLRTAQTTTTTREVCVCSHCSHSRSLFLSLGLLLQKALWKGYDYDDDVENDSETSTRDWILE